MGFQACSKQMNKEGVPEETLSMAAVRCYIYNISNLVRMKNNPTLFSFFYSQLLGIRHSIAVLNIDMTLTYPCHNCRFKSKEQEVEGNSFMMLWVVYLFVFGNTETEEH